MRTSGRWAMGGFLEFVLDGGTPWVLAASSGQIGARLPAVGTIGDLLIDPDASLVFCEPSVSEVVVTSSGLRKVTTASGSSTVIAAQHIAALNIHSGRVAFGKRGRNRVRACILEVTLTGADETAAFAPKGMSGSGHDRVRHLARQLDDARARKLLPEIEVTTSIDRDYLWSWP
jgi:hypothetical protein